MLQILVLSLAAVVAALPAADEAHFCTVDTFYKSLAYDGKEFCSALLGRGNHCDEASTPTQYATYDDSRLSHYCSCLLSPCHYNTTSLTTSSLPPYSPTNSTTVQATMTKNTTAPLTTGLSRTVGITETPPFPTTNATVTRPSTATGTVTLIIISSTRSTSSNITTSTTNFPSLPTPFNAVNFTGVRRGPVASSVQCSHLPVAKDGRLHKTRLKSDDVRVRDPRFPTPYIESVAFDSDGIKPLYITIRDRLDAAYHVDVSTSDNVSITDSLNNTMRLDGSGIHFTDSDCDTSVSFVIDNMYDQLAELSNERCSIGMKALLADEVRFQQTLEIRDQCEGPVGRLISRYTELFVANTSCNVLSVDDMTGTWIFDCPWLGRNSKLSRCVSEVNSEIVDFLLLDPFNGGCPDVSTVVTTLAATARDILSIDTLLEELYSQASNTTQSSAANMTAHNFEQLWVVLDQALAKHTVNDPYATSSLRRGVNMYNAYRNFANDACVSHNQPNVTVNMDLRAGASFLHSFASFNAVPEVPVTLKAKVQDPSRVACCTNNVPPLVDQEAGVCSYSDTSMIAGTGCLCGMTAGTESIAFKYRQCSNFAGECEVDADCAMTGREGYQCLTQSCCGHGVCFDPYECSRFDTPLI